MSDVLSPVNDVEAKEVLANAEVLIDEQQLQAGYDRMADQIRTEMADLNPVVVCIMLGGMHATVEITKRLEFPLELDYLQATRYGREIHGGELLWKVSPGVDLSNRHVLIIDDILDEGTTLATVLNAIDAQGAASIRTAMLLEKMHDRRVPSLKADFVGFQVEDRYVFGAGLDYKGYLRQIPAIYAVAAEHQD